MNDGKKRKITAWEYQYDNGEVALLYHAAGIWRGKKINTVQSEYYQNPHKAIARIRELEAKIPGKDNFTFRKRNFEAGIEYLSDRCDMGVPIEQQSKEAQHHACAALLQMLNSCGSDVDGRRTILQVVSASLSGYIFRLCSEWELFTYGEPVPYETAPRIVCSRADGAGNALRQVMASLFLDTEELLIAGAAAGSVESHLPAYLPSVGIICYDIQDLGENLKPIGLLVMLDSILNRVIRNRQQGRYTHVYIDEIYLFFASPGVGGKSAINNYSSEFLYKCWKRFRKYYATLTGITQNVEECLLSDTARLMFANSEFLVLLNQAPTDRAELAKLLDASDAQMDYVSDAPAGHGLIKVGSCLVPFINELPRDTELYRLMTTKPGEQNA